MPLLLSLFAALGGAWLFERLNVPAGAMIGAMTGVGALKLAGATLRDAPGLGRFLAFAIVGWALGMSFDRGIIAGIGRSIGPVVAIVAIFLLVGLALAWALWFYADIDPVTAFLATSPGGIVHIGVLSADAGAQVGIVMAIHLLRVVSVLVMAPLVVRLLPTSPL